jgi:uncharacterized membrane protein
MKATFLRHISINNINKESIMSPKTITLIVIAVIASIAAITMAVKHYQFRNASMDQKAQKIISLVSWKLSLSDTQKSRVNDIVSQVMDKIQEKQLERKDSRDKARELLLKESITTEEVEVLIKKRREAMEELKPFFVEKIVELHGILNSDQKKKLAEIMDKHHHRWHHGLHR